jgi:hypothetical protein
VELAARREPLYLIRQVVTGQIMEPYTKETQFVRLALAKENTDNVMIVGFFPLPETTEHNVKQMGMEYDALGLAYGVTCQLIRLPEYMLPAAGRPIVVIEEDAETLITDFVHPREAVYITGNSAHRYPSRHFPATYRVRVSVPFPDRPLYGSQATAIVLNDRYMKNGTDI